MDYFLEIEQRLFKPLADNHQALYIILCNNFLIKYVTLQS